MLPDYARQGLTKPKAARQRLADNRSRDAGGVREEAASQQSGSARCEVAGCDLTNPGDWPALGLNIPFRIAVQQCDLKVCVSVYGDLADRTGCQNARESTDIFRECAIEGDLLGLFCV